jgi:ATP-dependent Lon protease
MDNGAKKAVIPIENKRAFLEVPGDVAEQVDPVFYGEAGRRQLQAPANDNYISP